MKRIARRRDTLHLLALVLLQQAHQRGDTATVALIEDTITRSAEGDQIKSELMRMLS